MLAMIEVAGTSHVAKQTQFTGLLAKKTAPVFKAEVGDTDFTEVVVISYRDETTRLPVHGGMYAYGSIKNGITPIKLKDLAGKVDTSEDPAHVAIGVVMMRGPLVFRQAGVDQKMELSIVDLQAGELRDSIRHPSAAREAAKSYYLKNVLPDFLLSLTD